MLAELWNKIAYHKAEIERLEQEIRKFRETCDHIWESEEGYLFSGFYCRKCGSTK